MQEQPFPNTYTTTTTTTTTETKTSIFLDLSYLHTIAGRLKCIQIVLNLLGFICILSTILRLHDRGTWFNTVSMGGFMFTGIMLALYLFHITDKLRLIPWIKVEFVFCALWSLFYLIAASLAADWGSYSEAMAAAAFFGFAAMIAYLVDAYFKFQEIFGRVSVTTTRTPTTPYASPT